MPASEGIVESRTRFNKDILVYAVIVASSALIRTPFIKSFDLVEYDGTYYINIARSLLAGSVRSSIFPIGYPAFIALFIPLARDGVRAAQLVSLLAGLGSVILVYRLALRFVERSYALVACLAFAVTPLFVRLSMTTLSESIYVFWVLLGLLHFAKEKDLRTGLSIGMAAITRPEALGILAVLGVLRLKTPKRLLVIIAGFIIPYAANVAVQSVAADRFILITKTKLFGTSAEDWKRREEMLEFSTKGRVLDEIGKGAESRSIIGDYVNRMPRDLFSLLRHATPVIVLVAVFAFFRRRSFLLAGFVPLLFFPLFTFRTEPRFVFPYIPILILYAAIGVSTVEKRRMRTALAALLCASAVSGIALNRDQLIRPVSDGFQWAKAVGRSFQDRITPGDKIADRKPYFAFYAGGEYFEIPVAPINQTLEHLASNGVAFLVLHPPTVQMMRPQLLPMIYDQMFIRSEMRYSPALSGEDVLIYRKELDSDPLIRRQIVTPCEEPLYSPRWSPDGEMIAFRSVAPSGEGAVHIIDPSGAEIRRLETARGIDDPIAWAPDSKRIVFATGDRGSMNIDIAVYHLTGEIEYVTSHMAIDVSPSWSADGSEIIFSSTRTGRSEIWSKHLGTGALERITTEGGGSYPSISPDGKRIAWIREGEGLYLLDRDSGAVTRAVEPRRVNFAPAWSHDGGFIAVTGSDWGKMDVYLVTADGQHAVLLTKTTRREGQPGWSPDDDAIVTVTMQDEDVKLSVLTCIEAYKHRLLSLAWSE